MNDFSEKIKIDINGFFQDSLRLLQEYQPSLIEYYSNGGEFPKDAFDLLDKLELQVNSIYQKVKQNRNNFNHYFDFVVFDQIEDFASIFRMIENYSKWLRSSVIKGRYKSTSEIDYVLRQNQTIEEMSAEIGWTNREEGFLDLTLRNQIKETDYDLQGGLVFKFAYQNDKTLQLESVVDEMVGQNLLGKDINAKISFKDNDIFCLTPEDTFFQTCEILTGLMKNHNPEFPEDGFDKSAISNKNLMRVRLSTFIRQMYATVFKDDTIASFSITDVIEDADVLKIIVEYKSYLNIDSVKITV